jgi:hypothetical protein
MRGTKPYAPVTISAERLPNMAGFLLHPLHPAFRPIQTHPQPRTRVKKGKGCMK